MNRYGQLVLEHSRTHRPDAYSQIPDPNEFFTEAGATIATAISDLRDQILGPPRTNEGLEAYRHRGYQAWSTAEEIVLTDHHLLQPVTTETTETTETADEDLEDDPELADRYRLLAEINQIINQPL